MAAQEGFRGVYTALVTPFDSKGQVDYSALRKLVQLQLKAGIDGIVPCGTTGESPTLTEDEYATIFEVVVKECKGKAQVIGGAGSNSTAHAIHLSKLAEECGCDAVLQVNPYYNKPTQEGLYRHFKAINDAISIPIVLYNIQGRTGVNLQTQTLVRLTKLKNIAAVKEASGDISQMMDVIRNVPSSFDVLCGDDNLTFPLIGLGGRGVISVASNVVPVQMKKLVDSALKGDMETARRVHYGLLPLFKTIFIETNPIPIKAALAMRGLIKETYRLPLCEMQKENRKKLSFVLKELTLL